MYKRGDWIRFRLPNVDETFPAVWIEAYRPPLTEVTGEVFVWIEEHHPPLAGEVFVSIREYYWDDLPNGTPRLQNMRRNIPSHLIVGYDSPFFAAIRHVVIRDQYGDV